MKIQSKSISRFFKAGLFVAGLAVGFVPNTQAQDATAASSPMYPLRDNPTTSANYALAAADTGATVGTQGGKFGIGLGAAYPAYGLSGTMQISKKYTAEAILGLFGDITTIGGKVWYRFNTNEVYDIYGYGGVSMHRYRYRYYDYDPYYDRYRNRTETVPGVGAGAGLDLSLPKLIKDDGFPPLFLNFELGLALAGFEYYDYSALTWGIGIHYRFKGK